MPISHTDGPAQVSDDRRRFLRFLGAGTLAVGAAGTLAACDSSDPNFTTPDPQAPAAVTFNFSAAGDVGPLNYAYALEQLEGAFYGLVVANYINLFSASEQQLLRDLAAHEAIHRDFLAAALGDAKIPNLTLNTAAFANVNTRESILDAALLFEDLGVAAYNGAGRYIMDDSYLTIAGKIVSVEARHAAAIATARFGSPTAPRLGAPDVINGQGLDRAFAPEDVIRAASQYVLNDLSVTGA